MFYVSATVSTVSAKLNRPHEDAVIKCVGTNPTVNVSAWYRNSSDGRFVELSQKHGSKYLISDDTLTVLKVGEYISKR